MTRIGRSVVATLTGAAMCGGASDAAAQVRLGGPDDPVEARVDVDTSDVRHPSVRAYVRTGAGGVQVGPVNANVSPRVARPGNNAPSSQTQGSAPGAGSSNPQDIHVAPTNVEAQPRVASPGNDSQREQSNGHRRQVAPVNGSASPRVLSDGDSGRRGQSNGSAGNDTSAGSDTVSPPDGREGDDSQGPPAPFRRQVNELSLTRLCHPDPSDRSQAS